MKACAADPKLFRHRGPAVVFEDVQTIADRIDDPALGIDENSVLMLRNAGPVGAAMPEWGMLPLPRKLLERGVRDMVRISDARMSGTAYGAALLHVSPEAAIGGPLALVRTGDIIELDVHARRLDLCVDAEELARRRRAWRPPVRGHDRGYRNSMSSTSSRRTAAATSISSAEPISRLSPRDSSMVGWEAGSSACAFSIDRTQRVRRLGQSISPNMLRPGFPHLA